MTRGERYAIIQRNRVVFWRWQLMEWAIGVALVMWAHSKIMEVGG